MVHCIGTDTHDLENRAPNYTETYEAVKKAGFEEEWMTIQANMQKILADEEVEITTPKVLKKFFGKIL
jgi:tyrosine-protein phosphatase YwqE